MITPDEPYVRPDNEVDLLEHYGLPPDGDLSEIMGC